MPSFQERERRRKEEAVVSALVGACLLAILINNTRIEHALQPAPTHTPPPPLHPDPYYESLDANVHIDTIKEAGGYFWRGAPTISIKAFDHILEINHSPMAAYGGQIWDMLYRRGDNPARFLAYFEENSKDGTTGVAGKTDNMLDLGFTMDPQSEREYLHLTDGDIDYSRNGGWVEGAVNAAEYVEKELSQGSMQTSASDHYDPIINSLIASPATVSNVSYGMNRLMDQYSAASVTTH